MVVQPVIQHSARGSEVQRLPPLHSEVSKEYIKIFLKGAGVAGQKELQLDYVEIRIELIF